MSLSKKGSFSDEELNSLSLWHMPKVAGDDEVEAEPENDTPLLTVNEIEEMQKQAYDEAFAKGKKEGYDQGFKQGLEEGNKKGYQEGLDKGYKENCDLLKEQVSKLGDVIENLSEPIKTLDDRVEHELVHLAISIARQIIRRELKLDPGQIIATVREAINLIPVSAQKILIVMHPEDAQLVRSVFELDERTSNWDINEDPLISRGGCKVDTDVSHIDATVEKRITAVIAQVLGDERHREEDA